jgi:hypothetical protein
VPAEELIYPPPKSRRDTPPVDAVRGFVFLSGLKWMEKRGLIEKYMGLLPEANRARAQSMTAAEWIPLDVALIAYAACDALELSVQDQIDVGREVVLANNGVVLQTITKLIGHMGAPPWLALKHADRAWGRSNRGGAIAVYKLAEKQARLEFWQCPLARSPFFVTSMRGAIAVGLEPFCSRVNVVDLPEQATKDGFALRATWS